MKSCFSIEIVSVGVSFLSIKKRAQYRNRLFLLLVLIPGSLLGQSPSQSFYYPLETGNYWEYVYSPAFRETREVVGDTLMPNGQRYHIVEREAFDTVSRSFQRISDNNELFRIDPFETEAYLKFRLDAGPGESWQVPTDSNDSLTYTVAQTGDTTLLGHKCNYKRIVAHGTFNLEFIIADSIGIFFEGYEAAFLELQGGIINGRKFGTVSSVNADFSNRRPERFTVFHNYPNPFNPSTTFAFRLDKPAFVKLSVFNLQGAKVRLLFSGYRAEGLHRVKWSGEDQSGRPLASGTYFYRYEIDGSLRKFGKVLFQK